MVQPKSRRLATEAYADEWVPRVDKLDSLGQRGYVIDQTAGRTVKVWDYLNNREQLVYGDTGAREVVLVDGWECYGAKIRRTGSTVSMVIRNMSGASALSPTFYRLPSGFRDSGVNIFGQPSMGLMASKTDSSPVNLISVYSGALNTSSRGTDLQLNRTWTTSDPWPTSLPGVAA